MDLLSEHEVDRDHGFLPARDPLERLPPAYDAWERIAPRVSGLLLAGKLRSTLDALPIIDPEGLDGREELERAMLLLSVFGNAYVWATAVPARTLPPSIAVPWHDVAGALGRPPIVAHASIVLRNWRRIDPTEAISLANLETLQVFGGSLDERWFYLIPMAMEARGARALVAIVRARDAVSQSRGDELASQLETIATVVHELTDILMRTQEKCDPYIFYRRVRPYLAGWPAPGVIYQGVSDEPVRFAGGSAAQSSLFQAIDAALGVQHEDEQSRPFLSAMRGHMPPSHRELLAKLDAGGPELRAMVLERRTETPQVADRYNAAVEAMDRFRRAHFEIAVRYITRQAATPGGAQGTGGTELATFLTRTREETRASLLDGGAT